MWYVVAEAAVALPATLAGGKCLTPSGLDACYSSMGSYADVVTDVRSVLEPAFCRVSVSLGRNSRRSIMAFLDW
jgi:hypothetical protein